MQKRTRTLIRWGLVSENGRGPYLTGLEATGRERVSTPLVEFDPAAGTAVTASGRPYRLLGTPDPDYGLATTIAIWRQVFDLTGTDIRALTPDEAVVLMAERNNQPLETGPDDDELEAYGGGNVSADIGLPDQVVALIKTDIAISIGKLMTDRTLAFEEAAEIAEVEPDALRGIVEDGRVSTFSIERLDRVFEAIEAFSNPAPRS